MTVTGTSSNFHFSVLILSRDTRYVHRGAIVHGRLTSTNRSVHQRDANSHLPHGRVAPLPVQVIPDALIETCILLSAFHSSLPTASSCRAWTLPAFDISRRYFTSGDCLFSSRSHNKEPPRTQNTSVARVTAMLTRAGVMKPTKLSASRHWNLSCIVLTEVVAIWECGIEDGHER